MKRYSCQSKVIFMMAQIEKVFAVFILRCTPITEVMRAVHTWKCVFDVLHNNLLFHEQMVHCATSHQTLCTNLKLLDLHCCQHVCRSQLDEESSCCCPVIPLGFMLQNKIIVFIEIQKNNSFNGFKIGFNFFQIPGVRFCNERVVLVFLGFRLRFLNILLM